MTFHVPMARVLVQGLGCQGPQPRLPPKPHCIGPSWTFRPPANLGLSLAGPRGQRPGHKALTCEPQPRAWLQGGAPAELAIENLTRYEAKVRSKTARNVRSLPNKMEELAALTRLQREDQECSLMHFTETWLNDLTPDSLVQLDGFHLVRADRNIRESACELLHSVVAQLQTAHPPAFLLITGDFNHASLSATLPNFHQWSEEASDALRDCFDTTDWEVLCGPHEQDIDSLTDCITDYINFCVETTVPTKRVRCFSNNKPWVTPDLRALLQEKRTAFQSGDRDELRRVQRDLKRKIKECKASYRRKMEDHLQQNNVREVWRGLQAISGQGKNERRNPEPGDRDWANKLNLFFNRFDTGPTSTPLSLSTDQPTSSSLCLHAPSPPSTPPPSLGLSPSPPPSPPSLQCSSPPPPSLS
ncbi:hypothetical protein L3Q82_011590 [Scortum barcoo]|uniref:Uncharacterized protein n=1 Tax=Scortum barcoo TaxID=214431 RepID=A0ACB8W7G9_9TELE|nr:hypothetical protein L3Q82_011590 [Scortum barcoo]